MNQAKTSTKLSARLAHARTRKTITAAALSRALAKKGILVRSCGDFFGLDGQFIRVAVKRRADNRRFMAVLKTLF